MTSLSELELYKSKQDELVQQYEGQIIAMYGGEVRGVYTSKLDALEDMQARFPHEKCLIIRCTNDDKEFSKRIRGMRKEDFLPSVAQTR